MILTLLSLSSRIITGIGREVTFGMSKRMSLSNDKKEWCFIKFESIPNINQMKNDMIKIHSTDVVTPHLYRAFINGKQMKKIVTKYKCEVAPVLPYQKLLGDQPKEEVTSFIVEAHKSFNVYDKSLSGMNITKISKTSFKVVANNGIEALNILSQINEVLTICVHDFKVELLNRYNAGRVQRNADPVIKDGVWGVPRPLNDKGLTGKGVTALIVDTGIDMNSIYFYRANETFEFVNASYENIPLHSKIAAYDGKENKFDTYGHGTHVCGVFAGKAVGGDKLDDLYNGVAPDAKIAMLPLPKDVYEPTTWEMMQLAKAVGAQISTNSYGREIKPGYPNKQAMIDYDWMAYNNQDITVIFAAGNFGPNENTISDFAGAKNILAVASIETYNGEAEYFYRIPPIKLVCEGKVYEGMINTKWTSYISKLDPSVEGILKGMDDYTKDDIVLIDSDYEASVNKLPEDIRGVVYTGQSDMNYLTQRPGRNIPIFCIKDNIKSLIGKKVQLQPSAGTSQPDVALSSSHGISYDGIKKPDIAAVGRFSASANMLIGGQPGHKHRGSSSGTSFAAPLAAGAAALAIEYFESGKFNNKPLKPSSNTMRALLISSANPVFKKMSFQMSYGYEGYGEVNLSNVINLDNDPRYRLGIAQDIKVQNGDHFVATVNVKSKAKLTIGMAYSDKPMSIDSIPKLVNDVTLYVEAPNGKTYWGNQFEESASLHERVSIDEDECVTGDYKIHIICSSLNNDGPSNTSVVVVGALGSDIELQFTKSQECLAGCYGHGDCIEGRCKCRPGYFGSACQLSSEVINGSSYDRTLKLNGFEIKMLEIKIPEKAKKVESSIACTTMYGCPRDSQIFYSNDRPQFIWAADLFLSFKDNTISQTVFPNNVIGTKVGDTVYAIVYNMNTGEQDFAVKVKYEFDEVKPQPPVEESSSSASSPEEESSSASSSSEEEFSSASSSASAEETPASSSEETVALSSSIPASSSEEEERSSSSAAEPSVDSQSDEIQDNENNQHDQKVDGKLSQGSVIAIATAVPLVCIGIAVAVYFIFRHKKSIKLGSELNVDV